MNDEISIHQARHAFSIQKFREDYGEGAFKFACHAAIPVVLDIDFLHLLRINFFFDEQESISYLDEGHLLLSSLCHEIGDGMYEMEPSIRKLLLQQLVAEYDYTHIRELATLLWEYTERFGAWRNNVRLERAQQFTAMNFLSPAKAQQWLNYTNSSVLRPNGLNREWYVAILAEHQKLDKLVSLIQELLEEPSDLFEKHLAEFVSRIVPSYAQTLNIYSSINEFHSKMLRANSLPGKYVDTRLFGSLARRTAIYPSDVDILSIIQVENPRYSEPTIIHTALKKTLENIYGVQGFNKNRKRSLSFGTSIIVTVGIHTFEILPATILPLQSNNIMIPGAGLREWEQLDFDLHSAFTVAQNTKTNGQYSSLVQLIKWWARYHRVGSPYLSGFIIEALVADCMTHQYESLSVGFIDILDKIYAKCTNTKRALQIADPAIPNRMLRRVVPSIGVRSLTSTIQDTLKFAQQSSKTESLKEKLFFWEKIFGPTFTNKENFVIRINRQPNHVNQREADTISTVVKRQDIQPFKTTEQSKSAQKAERDDLAKQIMGRIGVNRANQNSTLQEHAVIKPSSENPKPSEHAIQLSSIDQVKPGMLVKGIIEEIEFNRIRVDVGLDEPASITFHRIVGEPTDSKEVEIIFPKGAVIEAYVVGINKRGRIQLRPHRILTH